MKITNFRWIWCAILILALSGCNTQATAIEPTQTIVLAIPSPMPEILATEPGITGMPAPSATPPPSPTLTPSPTLPAKDASPSDCPQYLPTGSPATIKSGSILFFHDGSENVPAEVWGLSAQKTEAQVVYRPHVPLNYQAQLSPDGTKIAWYDFSNEPGELVIDDLVSQQEARFPYPANGKYVQGWADDQRVKLYVNGESEWHKGTSETYIAFDIQAGIFEITTVELKLPDLMINARNPVVGGYASVDPSGTLVLYTTIRDRTVHTILREISSGRELWRSEPGAASEIYPSADWAQDGSKVAFMIHPKEAESSMLVSLSRDGQHLEVLAQISTNVHRSGIIRDIQWSPDGQYIYFADWWSSHEGPGYILDTVSQSYREICTPGYSFMSGTWLPESHQFIYTSPEGEDLHLQELGTVEFRLLDVDTWQAQTLLVDSGEDSWYINILGWSPLEWP